MIKGELGALLENKLDEIIKSEDYQSRSTAGQRNMLKKLIAVYRKQAKGIAEIETRYNKYEGGYTPFDRAEFARLTDDQTRLADEWYMQQYGMTVLEKQMEDPDRNHLMIGVGVGRLRAKDIN